MDDLHLYDLILDDEIKNLLPTPTTEQYTDMEEEIVYHGCPRTLLVWRNILLTDYMYYDICHKWDIPFKIAELNLPTRDDAMVAACRFIIEYQDISDIYYRYVIGKCFLSVKRIMSDVFGHRRTNPFPPVDLSDAEKSGRSYSAHIVSEMFNIAPGTASQYGSYATSLDNVRRLKPEIAEKIFDKKYNLSLANMISFGKMTAPEMQTIYDYTKNRKETGPTFLQIKKKLELQRSYSEIKGRGRRPSNPEIKQMPKYDPDAEISSLSLTIPMWISSMNRTLSMARFDQATPTALWKLDEKLSDLSVAIETLQKAIEEAYHE